MWAPKMSFRIVEVVALDYSANNFLNKLQCYIMIFDKALNGDATVWSDAMRTNVKLSRRFAWMGAAQNSNTV